MTGIKYLLLDLDGTLLNFDQRIFVDRYLKLVIMHFSDHRNLSDIPDWILEGTGKMLGNKGPLTNLEVFLNYFSDRSGLPQKEIWRRFISFYENDFDRMETIVRQNPDAKNFVTAAHLAGFALIIATQPVFPEIAIRHRLRWAGLAHLPFEFVTSIEKMYACKPHPAYFRQILDIISADPGECLMIGDDRVNDMASTAVGIPNFFIAGPSGGFSRLSEYLGIGLKG
jgi:HAD superfamily hydrolase (TIGR01549 family)